jgi:hypothetical protein
VGYYITLIEADDKPAVAFQTLDGNIFYKRADDADGHSWTGLPRNIEIYSEACSTPSMSLIGGYPAVAFTRWESSGGQLCYVQATDVAGADPWDEPLVAASHLTDDTGINPCLASIFGTPAMSYSVGDYGALDLSPAFIRSTSPTGESGHWNTPGPQLVAGGEPANALPTSLAQIGLYPHMAYYDRDTHTLWHVWGSEMDGTDWLAIEMIDDGAGTNQVGQYCDIESVNGRPAVAYWDSTDNKLKYAILR